MKTVSRRVSAGAALLALSLSSGPLLAHHGNAAFDRSKTVTVTGTVTKWQFINPHSGIWINVTDKNGKTDEWSGELQGTLDLYRHFGWNKNTFKPGDTITLIGNPARDGSHALWMSKVVFPDGKEADLRGAPD
jgi:hypothetical protein